MKVKGNEKTESGEDCGNDKKEQGLRRQKIANDVAFKFLIIAEL